MTEFLLKLCGLSREGAAEVSGVDFVLRNREWLGWVITLAVLLTAVTIWSYWRYAREILSARKRAVLIALRLLTLAVVLLLLLRPVLAFTLETSIRRTLLLLADTSGSMKIQDPRTDPSDMKRAAIAKGVLDPLKGLEQPLDPNTAPGLKLLPRVDVLRGMLKNEKLNLVGALSKDLDLAAFQFGQGLTDTGGEVSGPAILPWVDALQPSAPTTALGDALRDVIARKRGQSLAGIFVATDGASNAGIPPQEAAALARQEGIPLFIYGVGITSPRDIIVSSLLAQEVAFVRDELPVTVRVRAQGLAGESAKLVLTLTPAAGGEPKIVGSRDLTFAEDEDVVMALPFTPDAEGEYQLTARIEPRADEASPENNVVSQRLRVMDSKVRVLYVETTPRWEFRYIQSILARDRRLDAKFVLLEADPGLSQAERSPYLPAIPAKREDLLKFDLIIWGDVSAKSLSAEQQATLEEFVQKLGGSMLFIAGPRHSPGALAGTPLEKLLPVELEAGAAQATLAASGTMAELTPQGRASPLLRLGPDETESARIWKNFGKIYWTARVLRAKPSAQVLLVDADNTRANRYGKLVLAAFHQYGLGQVLYLGTDNTWRWRRNTGDRYHAMLWGQLAQKLGLHHLLGGSKRTQLSVDKKSYTTGERVAVYGRLYGSDYGPVRDASVEAGYTVRVGNTPGPTQDVTMRAVPGQPGMYRGEFIASSPGTHRFSVKSDPETILELDVTEPRFETGETAMNEALLRQMATASGGAYFREENLWQLPQAISAKAEKITSTVDGELWSSPLFFLLVLLLGSLEWWLRKRWQLK